MFILRKITGDGSELNFALGDHYQVILKEQNYKEFMKMMELPGHSEFIDLYGFVVYGNSEILMLFKNQRNYIMTETGKTFKNITDSTLEKTLKETISRPTVDELNEHGFVKAVGSPLVFEIAFGIDQFPEKEFDNQDISKDVLIDLDGDRQHFRVGYYIHPLIDGEGEWFTYDAEAVITNKMRWYDILPFEK